MTAGPAQYLIKSNIELKRNDELLGTSMVATTAYYGVMDNDWTNVRSFEGFITISPMRTTVFQSIAISTVQFQEKKLLNPKYGPSQRAKFSYNRHIESPNTNLQCLSECFTLTLSCHLH